MQEFGATASMQVLLFTFQRRTSRASSSHMARSAASTEIGAGSDAPSEELTLASPEAGAVASSWEAEEQAELLPNSAKKLPRIHNDCVF